MNNSRVVRLDNRQIHDLGANFCRMTLMQQNRKTCYASLRSRCTKWRHIRCEWKWISSTVALVIGTCTRSLSAFVRDSCVVVVAVVYTIDLCRETWRQNLTLFYCVRNTVLCTVCKVCYVTSVWRLIKKFDLLLHNIVCLFQLSEYTKYRLNYKVQI